MYIVDEETETRRKLINSLRSYKWLRWNRILSALDKHPLQLPEAGKSSPWPRALNVVSLCHKDDLVKWQTALRNTWPSGAHKIPQTQGKSKHPAPFSDSVTRHNCHLPDFIKFIVRVGKQGED